MNDNDELDEKDIDEVIKELEQEVEEEQEEQEKPVQMRIRSRSPKKKSNSYWRNLKYLWYFPYRRNEMQKHFQRLAGITPTCVARLTLPDKTVVQFTELPKWYDVLRWQISGFKFEVIHLEDI